MAYQASVFSERQNLFYPIDAQGHTSDGWRIARWAICPCWCHSAGD